MQEDVRFSHVSVLLYECIDALAIKPNLTYVDCTTGGGGHSFEIASRLGDHGRLICLDRDEDALAAASKRLAPFRDRVTFVHTNFSDIEAVLKEQGIDNLGGVLMDLGCSSYQFDTAERGFSYKADAVLDMRMDRSKGKTAYDVVNGYDEAALRRILFEYGEEKFAPRIARAIVRARENAKIETTGALADIIRSALPAGGKAEAQHPAKRSFQAIRIEVNGELSEIEPAIRAAAHLLVPGGRVAAISFHSLEDRIVKQTFASLASGCTCPRDFPVCVCGKKPLCTHVSKKPILPTEDELTVNPRSRSAKLRVIEKL